MTVTASIFSIIAIMLASFAVGFNAGHLLTLWQEQSKHGDAESGQAYRVGKGTWMHNR